MPQNTKNMFSRRKAAESICDMKMMPGRFTYELVSEMGRRTTRKPPLSVSESGGTADGAGRRKQIIRTHLQQ